MACCQQSSAVILTREGAPPEEIIKNHRLLDLISSFWLSGPGLASENLHFQLEFLGDADAVGVRIKQIGKKKSTSFSLVRRKKGAFTWENLSLYILPLPQEMCGHPFKGYIGPLLTQLSRNFSLKRDLEPSLWNVIIREDSSISQFAGRTKPNFRRDLAPNHTPTFCHNVGDICVSFVWRQLVL